MHPSTIIDALRQKLEILADDNIAGVMARYMRNQFAFLGISTPDRRKAARQILEPVQDMAPDELMQLVIQLWHEPEREFQYVGTDLLTQYARRLKPSHLPAVRWCIVTHAWWDTVDALAGHTVGTLVRDDPEMMLTMDAWIEDEHLWIRRTALLHQLHYKDQTREDRLFAYCRKTAPEKLFFIQKAIGWALRTYSRTAPDAVHRFVEECPELSTLSRREAMKHLNKQR